MSDQINPLSIHGELPVNLLDHTAQIAGVINAGASEIATGIAGVPELVIPTVDRAIGVAIQKTPGFGLGLKSHAALYICTASAVLVQQDNEGQRRPAVVAGEDIDVQGPRPRYPVK